MVIAFRAGATWLGSGEEERLTLTLPCIFYIFSIFITYTYNYLDKKDFKNYLP